MQLPSYRTSAKPKEEKKVLLYKKPWYQFWERKASHFHTVKKRKFIWNYIKKWTFPSETASGKAKDILYYTTEGRWVVCINTNKQVANGIWFWFLHGDTLLEIQKRLNDNSWSPNTKERKIAARIFEDLIEFKDGIIGKNREIRI